MPTPSAEFTVNGSTYTTAVAVAAGSTVTLALVSTYGVQSVQWSVVGNHSEAASNPVITPAGSPSGITATFTMPAGSDQGYLVQCRINGGIDRLRRTVPGYYFRAIIGVSALYNVPPVLGEKTERGPYGTLELLGNSVTFADSVLDVTRAPFSAVGDGTTDDSAAITAAQTAANAVDSPIAIRAGRIVYQPNQPGSWFDGKYVGPGQLKDSGGKRAPYFSAVKAAPASEGTHTSIITAFNGDMSRVQFAVEHRITGSTTLGQPTSGYKYTPETAAFYGYLFNSSGHNQELDGNGGRTSAVFMRVKVANNNGQGDCVAYNASGLVTGAKAGATDFLANPAVSLFNGDATAASDGVYLNPYEVYLVDGGYDVSAVGIVTNFERTNGTGALGCTWLGVRMQSKGAEACDSAFSAVGKWKRGLDFALSTTDFGTDNAAITLKAQQTIYWDASSTGMGGGSNHWYSQTVGSVYQYYDDADTAMAIEGMASGLRIDPDPGTSTPAYIMGAATGFGAITGTADGSAFTLDGATTALRIGQYLKAVVDALRGGHHTLLSA